MDEIELLLRQAWARVKPRLLRDRVDANAWNRLVSILSHGLLYGGEVPRPAGFVPERRRAYRPMIQRESPQRDEVLRRLQIGETIKEIAMKMNIQPAAVRMQVSRLCKQYRVHSLKELMGLFGASIPAQNTVAKSGR